MGKARSGGNGPPVLDLIPSHPTLDGIRKADLMLVHPSSILRAQDDESRHLEMRRFVEDLRKVAAELR